MDEEWEDAEKLCKMGELERTKEYTCSIYYGLLDQPIRENSNL